MTKTTIKNTLKYLDSPFSNFYTIETLKNKLSQLYHNLFM